MGDAHSGLRSHGRGRTSSWPDSRFAAGDFVIMLYASGNRDEAVFGPTAAQFDVAGRSRPPTSPSDSASTSALAPLWPGSRPGSSSKSSWPAIPTYDLVGPVEYVRSTLVRGAATMPMVLGARCINA